MTDQDGLCRHCRRKPYNRPRHLCWSCYEDKDTRKMYESASKFARRSDVLEKNGPAPPPQKPTDAPPGSDAKVEVLEARAKAGECLFHEADARINLR